MSSQHDAKYVIQNRLQILFLFRVIVSLKLMFSIGVQYVREGVLR